jgi:hypothetical protein
MTMALSRRYFVLRSDPADLSFFNEIQAAIESLEESHGLRAEYRGYDLRGAGLGRHSYVVADGAEISVVEDFQLHVRYMIVEAPPGHAIWSTDFPNGVLEVVPLDELQDAAAETMGRDPNSLVRMALGTGPTEDERSVALVNEGLRSEDDLVRFRAAEAAALTGWEVFIGELQWLAEHDVSPEVREMASKAFESCNPGSTQVNGLSEEGSL